VSRQLQRLLIRGVNWIGDAVLTLPAIRAIRRAYPGVHISLLVKPWVADIFKDNPDIDEIIFYGEEFRGLSGKLSLAKKLKIQKFDSAILLQNAFDAALITWLAGIPERIGYRRDWRSPLLTKAVPVPEDILNQHQVYYYLNLLRSIGIETAHSMPYMYLTDDERGWARQFLKNKLPDENSPLVGINPGATYGSAKRWPTERFAELIEKIVNKLDGRIILFGSTSEIEIANEISQKLEVQNSKLKTRILIMTGKTNLRQLAGLIAECDVFVTNDSGPMHMASALFVPVVAMFGSTDKNTTGPFGKGHKIVTRELSCAPCMERECPEGHLKCMTEITADEVFIAIKETLPSSKAVFLDKDGTLIEDKGYLNSFDELVVLPGVKESLQKLKKSGFKLIGITNQSGIARGIVDEKFVRDSNTYLQDELGIDDFFYCPHHPDDHCPCRKPEPMLPLMAKLKHRINTKISYVIGDKESDVRLAQKIGSKGILITHSFPENTNASYVAKDLNDAVEWILRQKSDSG
jgi:heptosyltransferase-2